MPKVCCVRGPARYPSAISRFLKRATRARPGKSGDTIARSMCAAERRVSGPSATSSRGLVHLRVGPANDMGRGHIPSPGRSARRGRPALDQQRPPPLSRGTGPEFPKGPSMQSGRTLGRDREAAPGRRTRGGRGHLITFSMARLLVDMAPGTKRQPVPNQGTFKVRWCCPAIFLPSSCAAVAGEAVTNRGAWDRTRRRLHGLCFERYYRGPRPWGSMPGIRGAIAGIR